MTHKLMAATAVLALTGLAGAAQAHDAQDTAMPEVIRFGIIPTESSMALKTTWEPFLQDMKEELGIEVQGFFASDYAGIIEAMRFDKVDVAWFGNKSAMEAVDRAGGEVFAQTTNEDGSQGYYSILITQKDSSLENLGDVLACDQSLDFGLGDPNSTSGFLVPMTFIFAANEVVPEECFDTVRNASHSVNFMSTAQGLVDVAASNTDSFARFRAQNPELAKTINVIWKSPVIPSDPIVWRESLAPNAKARIYHFIMTYGRNGSVEEVVAERKVLADLNWGPFAPSSNRQLLPIREMELTKQKMMVNADQALGEEQKAARLEQINAKLAEVKKKTKAMAGM